jgi:hypothetical protein
MTVTRFDVFDISARVSPEGWIRDKPVVTRAGIFTYKTKDGKTIREYRPSEEVFKEDSLATMLGIPVTDNHVGLVNKNNVDGIVGSVLSPGEKAQDLDVVADVIIHHPTKIGDKRELSLAYECEIDTTPGEYNGERYDCIQKNIKYNSLAVVKRGRAGNARLRLDSTDASSAPFEQEKEMAFVTVRLDDIDYQAAPEVSNALVKAQSNLVDLQKKFDSVEAERDTLVTKVNQHAAEVKAVKDNTRNELRARLELEAEATKHAVKFDEDDSDRNIKIKVIDKINPVLKFDGKSDDYVDSAYDLTLDAVKNKKVSSQKERLDSRNKTVDDTSGSSAASSREKMLARMRGEDTKAA